MGERVGVSRDLLITTLWLVGSFDELAVLECRAGRDQRDEWGALTARHRVCADSMSLNAIAIPAALEPGALGDLAGEA
jgi:hypothetical protein